jgi:hypothetical protein
MISVLAGLAVIAAAYVMTRAPAAPTCFDRLGGPGPNSNTPRLDTWIEVSPREWPAVAQMLQDFAAEQGWSVEEGSGNKDRDYRWLDMCDDKVTIVRASNQHMGVSRIGFGIIHMTYDGAGKDGWRPVYRDLHRRLEQRWPGKMHYIEGEFGRPIGRPDWLGDGDTPNRSG